MDLVILAAGMGSRFGGLKQIQPIDDDNNFIIDYSIYDAIKAGFDRVIFIIRKENFEIFKSTIGNRLSKKIEVVYAFQELDNVPEGTIIPETRTKPWGTAHAIYTIKDIVRDRFAIINSDDYYGQESFQIVADFLKTTNDDTFANVAFYIKNTLSDKGLVNRGIFEFEEDYFVKSVIESKMERREDGKIYSSPVNKNNWVVTDEHKYVSMNLFGFTNKYIEGIKKEVVEFFRQRNLDTAEFFIPYVANKMIQNKEAKLKVISTPSKWYGITYKEDLPLIKEAIKEMKKAGIYPEHLYD